MVLVEGLPPESATKTKIRDEMTAEDFENAPEPDGHGPWSHEAVLLAAACDRIDWLTHVLLAVNSDKGKAPDPPKPMRRPGIGASGADRRELRRKQWISAAHAAYVMEHDGAAPPPGWHPGEPDD